MDITSDTARLLLDIGTMAAWRGDTIDARTILEGLHLFRQDSPAPQIGQAVALMNEGRDPCAIEVLDEALAVNDDCDVARIYLALACKRSGYDARSRDLCEQVLTANRDVAATELAEMLLKIPAEHASPQSSPV